MAKPLRDAELTMPADIADYDTIVSGSPVATLIEDAKGELQLDQADEEWNAWAF
jgi:hypothetical protein